ncbi:MAG: hypothetical protein E2O56_06085 [Gammaproteobacteria bacterium]|nr:MAG: hypothetical protein E2O56_06085 [Gammaproteobacteria bacterium]
MQSGNTFRMRLDGSHIEHFTYGQVNPFGMAMNELGDLFTADCHTKPITLLLEGGYYESFGKPHDGLGFVPSVMQHLHGSTAIGGIALYSAADFPATLRGNTFSGNVMTSRINRNSLHYDGSSVRATREADFLVSRDPWFRPVDLQLGPDVSPRFARGPPQGGPNRRRRFVSHSATSPDHDQRGLTPLIGPIDRDN